MHYNSYNLVWLLKTQFRCISIVLLLSKMFISNVCIRFLVRGKRRFQIIPSDQVEHDGQFFIPVLVMFPTTYCLNAKLKLNYKNGSVYPDEWINVEMKSVSTLLKLKLGTRYEFNGTIECKHEYEEIAGTVLLGNYCKSYL